MAKNLRLSSTALAAAFVLALVAASSTVRPVGAGRPAPGDDPNAVMRGTTTAAAAISATKQQPDQTAAATDAAGPSGCSSNPNNGGGRCPHGQTTSSRNSSIQTTRD